MAFDSDGMSREGRIAFPGPSDARIDGEMLEDAPFFIVEGDESQNVAWEYKWIASSDVRTMHGLLRYGLYHLFGQSGHLGIVSSMGLAKKRVAVWVRAYDDHLLVHDPLLKDVDQCSKSRLGAMMWDYIQECCRDIKERTVEVDGKPWVRLDYDQIVAAFYTGKHIVLRFCWETGIEDTYDAIIEKSRFVEGTADEFLDHVEPFYRYKMASTKPKSGVRLTSEAANPVTEGPQIWVRIYGKRRRWMPRLRKALSRVRAALMPKGGATAGRGRVEKDGAGRAAEDGFDDWRYCGGAHAALGPEAAW